MEKREGTKEGKQKEGEQEEGKEVTEKPRGGLKIRRCQQDAGENRF